jgi:hypothetical protein
VYSLVSKKSFLKYNQAVHILSPMLLRNNIILCLFYLHIGTSLPVPVSKGTIKCCQTFEHVFSLRTGLRYEGSNVSCEVLPTERASTTPPSMLREFQTATKGVRNFRYYRTGLHMTS